MAIGPWPRLSFHGVMAIRTLYKIGQRGFLKALHNLNDHFGNMYLNVGEPLSAREFYKQNSNVLNSSETSKPMDLQAVTPEQFKQVQSLADYVITLQQKNTVATISNLVALVLMQSLMKNEPLKLDEVYTEVEWMIQELRILGAKVFENDVKGSVDRILVVHQKMMKLDHEGRLKLIYANPTELSDEVKKKMKGHILHPETMATAVSVIQLQLYVNPVLHYLVPPALVYLTVQRDPITTIGLKEQFRHLRKMLSHEFFYIESEEPQIFKAAIDYCVYNGVCEYDSETDVLSLGKNSKRQFLLTWTIWPFLATLYAAIEIMRQQRGPILQADAVKLIQCKVEDWQGHPYSLSLEAARGCLRGLADTEILIKHRWDDLHMNRLRSCLVDEHGPYFHGAKGQHSAG
ncbi:hypothetical protein HW555_007735 [Spodoptera exigua]|uniref:GPAT/DHAPAT C-terminal domain-containing protein n=1 Tax=Spodoptera exigua TaxID=7107 RepID=A0A835GFG6_SPOEX|nr:hypothetical protein HW555_007735 [Spodoptera exigua]